MPWFLSKTGECTTTPVDSPIGTFSSRGHCEGFVEMYQKKSGGDQMLAFSPFVTAPGHTRDALADTPHHQWHALVSSFADQET